MAGTTTLGYPYPSATDSISDEAAKVQELAQAVDDKIGIVKCGLKTIAFAAINTDTTVAVAFAVAFPAAGAVPQVTATVNNGSNPASYEAPVINNVTRSGFNLTGRRSVGVASLDVAWIAVAQ